MFFFTPLQHQLLQMYAMDFSEAELLRVRHLVASILSERIDREMDKVLANKNVDEWAEEMLSTHMRTPYTS